MKGAAQYFIIFAVIIIYVVVLANGLNVQVKSAETISSQTYKVTSTLNHAEYLKRTINSAVFVATEDIDKDISADSLKSKIEDDLEQLEINEINNKKIIFGEPEVNIESIDNGFIISGSYPFTITNAPENPTAEFKMSGNFYKEIKFE